MIGREPLSRVRKHATAPSFRTDSEARSRTPHSVPRSADDLGARGESQQIVTHMVAMSSPSPV